MIVKMSSGKTHISQSTISMETDEEWAICKLSVFHHRLTVKAMAPHSSTPAWKIPWTEEPGRLQSMGSLRVGHD